MTKTLNAEQLGRLADKAAGIAFLASMDSAVRAEIVRCVLPELIENEKESE